MAVMHVTASSFSSEVLNSDKPVLVDFWASWCGPCKMLAPVLDEVSEEVSDKAKIVKINVDEEPSLAMEYGIMSIPTMIVFKNGQQLDKIIGLRPKNEIIDILKK